MKVHLSILEKFIELPTKEPAELRALFDDVISEVKGIEGSGPATVFTIETLANRGDHVSTLGIARELSARLLSPVSAPAVAGELTDRKTSIPVRIETPKCLRYALLEMALASDMQLRPEIAAIMSGSESTTDKHAIVDTLNYIQIEIGQPMHAFDREKVDGEISIAETTQAEKIEALDGKAYTVPKGAVVIKDKKKIIAVAGVIGCKNSMVTAGTTGVLVESATFDPVSVRITARAMGISTDASFIFERGADREMTVTALKRLVTLVQAGGGMSKGSHVLGFQDVNPAPPDKRKISLKLSTIRTQLNLQRLADIELTSRLKNLGFGFEVAASDKSGAPIEWKVTVPTWRLWDVQNEEDLTEEFARVHGYNKVKLELPPLDYEIPEDNPVDTLLQRVEGPLHGSGFIEVISKIFYTADDVALLESLAPGIKDQHLTIKNAVERNYSNLKVTNLIHLARLSGENHRHGVLSFKAYEFGRVFSLGLTGGSFEFERDVLTLAASGRWTEHEWQKPETTEELLFLFKGVLENVARSVGIAHVAVAPSREALLHPGCQGSLKAGRETLGSFGLLHPKLKQKLDLKHDVVFAELDAAKLIKCLATRTYQAPSDFPAVRRDITLKLPATTMAGKISKAIVDSKPANLADVSVIDTFRKADEDFRRVTFRLTFQSSERTLESGEVDQALEATLGSLKSGLGIERL